MLPFLQYLHRKFDAHQVDSLFWTRHKILAPQTIFFGYFWTSMTLRIQKVSCGFAGEVLTIFGATKGINRASPKTSRLLCLLGIDSWGTPIWLSMRSTSHKILKMWCVHISFVARNAAVICPIPISEPHNYWVDTLVFLRVHASTQAAAGTCTHLACYSVGVHFSLRAQECLPRAALREDLLEYWIYSMSQDRICMQKHFTRYLLSGTFLHGVGHGTVSALICAVASACCVWM